MRILLCSLLLLAFISPTCFASSKTLSDEEIFQKRMELYKRVETVTNIPWYYMAAVDHYERSIRSVRNDLPKAEGITGIYFKPEQWSGLLNPDRKDVHPLSIQFFNGIGVDGNGDGKANINDDVDILFSFANHILNYGIDEDQFKIALWEYYKRDKTVGIIMEKARLYKHFGRLDLNHKTFPLPRGYNYTYHNTWGDSRGWGGRRIHEGTDIFAGYGVPVRSTSYGIVEMKGWNKFGGWRVGIRDINNTYHYFAHLNGFAKGLKIGQIVKPGTLIGSVGSTGYGPPGTSGKFPPHLHYGMYKDNGRTEWSFDPYPYLKQWERLDRIRASKK
ncbi:peptidase M23 [Heyndrickxia sporothermodurans]|uniref:M23 family metallopeptidase n=1 Tax=Heyndrickxia sporothermodurans TaxID=46224 RepID=UPI000D43DF01|nr:M23 family metallopeptidase [Heyndrickxia sporothermodurans]PTY78567.1 peptidase M23 [Heyndrickxia sporothermodurans]